MVSCEPPLLGLFAQAFRNATSFSLCTLYCETSLGHPSRSRHILGNLESFRTSRYPHLHGCRLCLHAPLVALAMVPGHRLLQWDTISLCSWRRLPWCAHNRSTRRSLPLRFSFSHIFQDVLASVTFHGMFSHPPTLCHTFLQYVTISVSPTL